MVVTVWKFFCECPDLFVITHYTLPVFKDTVFTCLSMAATATVFAHVPPDTGHCGAPHPLRCWVTM